MKKLYTLLNAVLSDLIDAVQLHFFPKYHSTKNLQLQPIRAQH